MITYNGSCDQLLASCGECSTRAVKRILEKNPQLINCVAHSGITPLISAAEHGGSKALIALLIERGADLHLKDKFGRTALYAGISSLPVAAIELMLSNGADPNVETTDSETPLTAAIVSNRTKVFELLLTFGANSNYRCKDGGTAAYYAVYEKRPSFLRRLIEAGAEVGQPGPRNATLLEWSKDKKSRSMIIRATSAQRDERGSQL
ncbi:MAG: ankyrin repeat domain-containing protein [Planctomycetota bacterium]